MTGLLPAACEALLCLHLIPIIPSLGPALPPLQSSAPNPVVSLVVRAQRQQPGGKDAGWRALLMVTLRSSAALATETGLFSPANPRN